MSSKSSPSFMISSNQPKEWKNAQVHIWGEQQIAKVYWVCDATKFLVQIIAEFEDSKLVLTRHTKPVKFEAKWTKKGKILDTKDGWFNVLNWKMLKEIIVGLNFGGKEKYRIWIGERNPTGKLDPNAILKAKLAAKEIRENASKSK